MSEISILRTDRTTFSLTTEIRISRPIGKVFSFFSDASNLEKLTPATLQFKILTPHPMLMQVGTRIDYSLKLYGIPISWQSEITAWEPPFRFVDEQRRGPYKKWVHEHKFENLAGDTLVSDEVEYLPRVSWLTHRWVQRDLNKIFAYRHKALERVFK